MFFTDAVKLTILPSPANCTVRIETDRKELYTTYTTVFHHTWSQEKFQKFFVSFTEYVPKFIVQGRTLDVLLIGIIRSLKFFSIMEEISFNLEEYRQRPHAVFTNAKRKLLKTLFQTIRSLFLPLNYTNEQVKSTFQTIVQHMEWHIYIFLLTHSNTSNISKICIEKIIEGLSTDTCINLHKMIKNYCNDCKNILPTTSSNPSTPNAKESKIFLKTDFIPVDVEFKNNYELFFFFIDYFQIICSTYANMSFRMDGLDALILTCPRCLDKVHLIDLSKDVSSIKCKVWKVMSRYFSIATNKITFESEKIYTQFKQKIEEAQSLSVKLRLFLSFIKYPLEYLSDPFSEVDSIVFTPELPKFVRMLLTRILYRSAVFKPYSNFISIIGHIYSEFLKCNFVELRKIQMNSIFPSFTHFEPFLNSLPSLHIKNIIQSHLWGVIYSVSNFYLGYKFIYQAYLGFKKHLICRAQEPRVKRQKNEDSKQLGMCIICQEMITKQYSHCISLCLCKFWDYHIDCYGKFVFKHSFRCEICKESFIKAESLYKYFSDYDMNVLDEITFEPFSIKPVPTVQQSGITSSTQPQSPIRDACSVMKDFNSTIKSLLLKMATSYLLNEKLTLLDFHASYEDRELEFVEIIRPHHKSVMMCVESFLKEYIFHETVKDEERDVIWSYFLEDWWKPLEELNEQTYYDII